MRLRLSAVLLLAAAAAAAALDKDAAAAAGGKRKRGLRPSAEELRQLRAEVQADTSVAEYLRPKPEAALRVPVSLPPSPAAAAGAEDAEPGMLRWSPDLRERGALNEHWAEDHAPDAAEEEAARRAAEAAAAEEERQVHLDALAAAAEAAAAAAADGQGSGSACACKGCCGSEAKAAAAAAEPAEPAAAAEPKDGAPQQPRAIRPVMNLVRATVVPEGEVGAPVEAPPRDPHAPALLEVREPRLKAAVFGRAPTPELMAATVEAAAEEPAGAAVEVVDAKTGRAVVDEAEEALERPPLAAAQDRLEDEGPDAPRKLETRGEIEQFVRKAVNVTAPVRFPGDGGEPLTCHTPKELRRYLDYVGADHYELNGVSLLATPFVRHGEERRDERHRVVPDGFHYFWQHGDPDNFLRGRRCFDPDLEYETTVELIGPDSREVVWGCTPFRVLARPLQESVRCARDAVGADAWLRAEAGVLRALTIEAQRQAPRYFRMMAKVAVMRYSRSEEGRLARFDRVPKEQRRAVAACFRPVQRPLMCAPAMSGTSGVLGNGVRDHEPEWVEKVDHPVKLCAVPRACSRLAAEELLHFGMHNFAPSSERWANLTVPRWAEDCRLGGRGSGEWWRDEGGVPVVNDRLYAACAEQALLRMCRKAPECCPSTAVHVACRKGLNEPRCADVCEVPGRHGEMLRSEVTTVNDARLDAAEELADMRVAEDERAAAKGELGNADGVVEAEAVE